MERSVAVFNKIKQSLHPAAYFVMVGVARNEHKHHLVPLIPPIRRDTPHHSELQTLELGESHKFCGGFQNSR